MQSSFRFFGAMAVVATAREQGLDVAGEIDRSFGRSAGKRAGGNGDGQQHSAAEAQGRVDKWDERVGHRWGERGARSRWPRLRSSRVPD